MKALLSGIRVVSLAEQYPGPYCTLLLADLGADVILVERPGSGDPARGPSGRSSFFAALNRNKRSITLNLKHERGREIGWELLATADVLVEGFRPGVMERLGFGHDRVLERLPGLVYCSISGYGQQGPYRGRAGHDLSYQAVAGLLDAWLDDDVLGYRSPVAIGDLSSAMFAAFGIVGALLHRERAGVGQYLDVSMTDGLVSWMGPALERVLQGAPPIELIGEPAYGVFRCGDGRFLTLSIAHEDHFWRHLCRAIGRPDLADLGGRERRARRAELRQVLAQRLQTQARDHWLAVLMDADVPAGPVLSLEEVIRDPHLRAREMFPCVEGSDGTQRHVAHPIKFSAAPARPPAPAPALGEHTAAILGELGHPDQEIERLRSLGAIGSEPPPHPAGWRGWRRRP